jgi:malate dehydrogenase (oxaloacetate-decarboxylating)
MAYIPSPSYSITLRLEVSNRIGMFAKVATVISKTGGDLGYVNIVGSEKGKLIREIMVNARDDEHEIQIVSAVKRIKGVRIIEIADQTYSAHLGGKISIQNKIPIVDSADLARVYTPGVARICKTIHDHPLEAYKYTVKGTAVAIITDGSAVLGLGNIGAEASLPVMEGKAMIFKEFAGINAYPIPLATQDPDEIIATVRNLTPGFGGINLEDISAPRCFEIERRLQAMLDIPVFHDDQHGTATVVLAGLINAGRLLRKDIRRYRVVIAGAGAAGIATAILLNTYGIKDIIVCDRAGALFKGRRKHMNYFKRQISAFTNPRKIKGSLSDCMKEADVFIGVSGPDIITLDDVKSMSPDPTVFALANPDPEVSPEEVQGYVRILATGRSDYPNQVNNMLVFPGLFRGLLDIRASTINCPMLIAASTAIAETIDEKALNEDYIVPSLFDMTVVQRVAESISDAALKTCAISEATECK